jgi:hypothetical protein
MEAVKKATESSDAATIQKVLDHLTSVQHKAAESMYRQQAPGGAPGGDAGAGGQAAGGGKSEQKSGDVIDAEVVDEGKQ